MTVQDLFRRFALAWGAQKLAAQYRGFQMDEVEADWAESLRGTSTRTVLRVLDHFERSGTRDGWPPSKAEFLAACRQFRDPPSTANALPDAGRGSPEAADEAVRRARQKALPDRHVDFADGIVGTLQRRMNGELARVRPGKGNRVWAYRLMLEYVAGRALNHAQLRLVIDTLRLAEHEVAELLELRGAEVPA